MSSQRPRSRFPSSSLPSSTWTGRSPISRLPSSNGRASVYFWEHSFWPTRLVFTRLSILRPPRANLLCPQYCNDSTLKNVHWALCTGVFGKRDVGRIEREFLDVLDFELSVTESDLLSHHDAIISLAYPARAVAHTHHTLSTPASRHHRHHHRAAVKPTSASLPSRWSDSSDSSSDLSTSPATSPLPVTPRAEAEGTYAAVVHSSPEEIASAQELIKTRPADSHSQTHHHKCISSALSLLRSFPMPHFHHPQTSPLSASSSGSSSTACSSTSSIPRYKSASAGYPHSHSRPAMLAA
jgi:hypothetical protein